MLCPYTDAGWESGCRQTFVLSQLGSSEMGELQPVPTSLLWCKCRMMDLPEQRGTKGSKLSHCHLPCVPCRLSHPRSAIRMRECILSWTFLGSENGFRGFLKDFFAVVAQNIPLLLEIAHKKKMGGNSFGDLLETSELYWLFHF